MIGQSTLGRFGSQTTFSDAGEAAAAILALTNALLIAAVVIFAIVMAILAYAWIRGRPGHTWWIWAGGIALPVVALGTLVVGSTLTLASIGPVDRDAMVVEVTGHQYWWDVRYIVDGEVLRDANEVHLPEGVPVTLRLKSADVIHSYWVPSISGKMDMIPGRINEMTVTATEVGRFRGQCAEFCGLSHPLMAFEAVVLPPAQFAAFLDGLGEEARDADTLELRRGRDVFVTEGCGACHAIRGVTTGSEIGPDLSRVGARASLGAGMWRMNVGNLAGWIADVQDMKPGAEMPSFNHLGGPDLRAVAQYLASLK